MASVYENAYLTIAATAAETSIEGIFQQSPQAEYVAVPCKFDDPEPSCFYLSRYTKPGTNIFDAPLNRRGWVLQEHLFARRTVHVAGD
jgi:hypothetical protein